MNIISFRDLDLTEKELLYNFIKEVTPDYYKSFDETNTAFEGELYSFGESVFILYKDNAIKGAIAVITKEIPIRCEAFINIFYLKSEYDKHKIYLSKENEEVFLNLLDKSVKYCSSLNTSDIKIGVKKSETFLIPYIEKANFNKAYNAVIMKYAKTEIPILPVELELIPLSSSNALLYQNIHNEAFRSSPNGATINIDEVKDYISSYQSQPDFVGLCRLNDDICGAYQLCIDDNIGWIDFIAVHPDYQNKGLGYLILNQCINKLYRHNVNSIKLLVITSNTNAMNLYSKNGFEEGSVLSTWFKYSPKL